MAWIQANLHDNKILAIGHLLQFTNIPMYIAIIGSRNPTFSDEMILEACSNPQKQLLTSDF